jgi:UDP-glucose 4-epimerase
MSPDPVLVTGGSGFIGSALVASLRADDVPVVVADLVTPSDPTLDAVVGDLTEPDVLAAALAHRPRVIFHLAARTSVLQSVHDPVGVYRVNVDLTQQLLEGARAGGTRSFVLASTNAVVGESGGAVIDESSPLRPLTPYGATKAAAEMLCSAYGAAYGMAVAAIRLTNVYGYGMGGKDTFVVRLLRAAAAGRPVNVYGDGHQLRDYLFVDDAVAAFRRACTRELDGPLVVGTGVSTSVLDLCAIAREALGIEIASATADAPAGEMRAVRVDIARARALGYEPSVALPEGLVRTWDALAPERAAQ